MKLTREQAEARLNSERNAINIIHKKLYGDRAKGITLNIQPTVRALIGLTANRDGAAEAARTFGVDGHIALAASKGKVFGDNSRQSREDPQLKAVIEADLKQARSTAISRALAAMTALDDESLSKATAKDKAAIARDMASVYDKLSNKAAAISGSGATVIIYSPREKREDEFDTIDVEAHVAG